MSKYVEWYKKVLAENGREIASSAVAAAVFAFALAIWRFLLGKAFVWEWIEPISMPDIPSRLFYSAIVFFTLGAFLYRIKFYQLLYAIFVQILNNRRGYRKIKAALWSGMIVFMHFWIIPKVVALLNGIISIFYNLLVLSLYLAPSIAVGTAAFLLARNRIRRPAPVVAIDANVDLQQNPEKADQP